MIERRKFVRLDIATAAGLFFGSNRLVLPCVALNVSNHGLKIATERLYALPLRFLISFDGFISAQSCRIIWLRFNTIGIEIPQPVDPNKFCDLLVNETQGVKGNITPLLS